MYESLKSFVTRKLKDVFCRHAIKRVNGYARNVRDDISTISKIGARTPDRINYSLVKWSNHFYLDRVNVIYPDIFEQLEYKISPALALLLSKTIEAHQRKFSGSVDKLVFLSGDERSKAFSGLTKAFGIAVDNSIVRNAVMTNAYDLSHVGSNGGLLLGSIYDPFMGNDFTPDEKVELYMQLDRKNFLSDLVNQEHFASKYLYHIVCGLKDVEPAVVKNMMQRSDAWDAVKKYADKLDITVLSFNDMDYLIPTLG